MQRTVSSADSIGAPLTATEGANDGAVSRVICASEDRESDGPRSLCHGRSTALLPHRRTVDACQAHQSQLQRRLSASSIRDRMTRFVGSMTMYGFCCRCILATMGRGHRQRETGKCPANRNVEQGEITLTGSVRSSQLFLYYNAGRNVHSTAINAKNRSVNNEKTVTAKQ